jgi:hypothetical protein
MNLLVVRRVRAAVRPGEDYGVAESSGSLTSSGCAFSSARSGCGGRRRRWPWGCALFLGRCHRDYEWRVGGGS